MKRRRFLAAGAAAAAAPAVLPFSSTYAAPAATTPLRRRGAVADDGWLPAVERLRREPPLLDGELRLNANENPLGPSGKARQAAIDALEVANRYPGDAARALRQALAGRHGVAPETIQLGNGSTELIQVAIQTLASPGYTMVQADPTFDDVSRYADPSGVEVVRVPLTADHQHDIGAMDAAARRAQGPVLVYVCNPNNPTGTLTDCDDVAAMIDGAPGNIRFLVDEAYFEYPEDPGYRAFVPEATRNPNVVVLRTFSKVHGMAGMRLGYSISHPDTARRLHAFNTDVNTNQLAVAAALVSLEDEAHVERSLRTTRQARDVLYGHLDRLGIGYIPTQASFVMHRITGEHEAFVERMRDAGFRVGRAFPPMLEYDRLSLATPEDMERYGETLTSFREKGWV